MVIKLRDKINGNHDYTRIFIGLSISFLSIVILESSALAVNYKLPFPCDEIYKVTQGNYADDTGDELPDPGNSHGCFDANEAACDEFPSFNKLTYAFDFKPDEGSVEGSEVVAAAKGTVAKKPIWKKDGPDPPNGNHIIILHDDGSETMYLHLQKNSIPEKLRNKGAIVEQGELVGKIGATGLVDGAHLHFQRRIGMESVPINFFDVEDNCGIPVATATMMYKSEQGKRGRTPFIYFTSSCPSVGSRK